MPKKYKLTYFDARGRAETARLLFAAGKKHSEYEDCRIKFPDWPEEKKKTPQGSVPVLEIDGKSTVVQSMAINRYLAREFGLYGKSNEEALYIDEIADTAVDLFHEGAKIILAPPEAKEKVAATFKNETAPRILGYIEDSMTKRAGKKEPGFAVGSKLSLADIMVFNAVDIGNLEGDLSKYPRIKASVQKVREDKGVAQWLKDRP